MAKIRMIAIFAAITATSMSAAKAADDVMVVLDGSNSMWGQIEGTAKIEIARDAMDALTENWTDDTNVGLMAYGHRRDGDCGDIETLIQPGPFHETSFLEQVAGVTPRGKTPLTTAVEQAAEALSYRDNPATVVLVTDGIESCQRDPCALADDLERMGIGFTAHVVGFDLDGEEQAAVACMAERTGGRFVAAANAQELGSALSDVANAVAEAPAQPTRPAPEPEPEPVSTPAVTLDVPETAPIGATFGVSWEAETQNERDFVTIVPVDADAGEAGHYRRVQDKSSEELRAPADPGFYEARYVSDESRMTLAYQQIEIVAAEASVEAPGSAVVGSVFPVAFSRGIHPRDYVTIVPAGADEGEHGHYRRVGENTEDELRAPAEPGLYEVRYVLEEGNRTLASTGIEIVAAEATVDAPESVTVGATFSVEHSQGVHPRDYVTIVPMGAAEGEHGNYSRVGEATQNELRAPAEPGLYEIRYVLDEGSQTIASTTIDVVEAGIELTGPATARAQSEVRIGWSGTPPHPRDTITIVPVGTDEGEYGDYARVGNGADAELTVPDQIGLYEIRYVLDEGRRTLARHMIEVVDADAALNTGGELKAPAAAAPGETVNVQWSAEAAGGDRRISLANADQADFTWLEAKEASGEEVSFTLPGETGAYEFRLLDIPNRSVLSRVTIMVE